MRTRIPIMAPIMALVVAATPGWFSLANAPSETLVDAMEDAVRQQGVDGAVARCREFQKAHGEDSDLGVDPVIERSVTLFRTGQRQTGIGLMEAAKRLFPGDVRIYSVLGQFYWYEDNRDQCIENFRRALEINPGHKTASRFWDLLFFVPEEFEVPESMTTEHLRVRPLRASDVDLDYQAVMSSVDHLRGVFGPDDDWPSDDLSRDDDLHALKNHEKEFEQRSAFTYTVMDHDEKRCLGCVYILPCHAKEYDAQVYLWVTKDAFGEGRDAELYSAVKRWIEADWPFSRVAYPGRDLDWATWATIDKD